MKNLIALAIGAVYLSGCAAAANYRPVTDMRGVDSAQYERDLGECQRYSQQTDPAARALAGAVVGALFMGALGAAVGIRDGSMYRSGAVIGGASAGAQGMETQVDITRRCMSGRGYQVLS